MAGFAACGSLHTEELRKGNSMQVVVPSRLRTKNMRRTLELFPDAIICVAEEERESYKAVGCPRILTHPNELVGGAVILHWALQQPEIPDRFVWADDDIEKLAIITGFRKRFVRDPKTIETVLEHAAICAEEAGTGLFGFNREPDVRKYDPSKPFTLRGWSDCVRGFVGRGILPKPRRRIVGGNIDLFLRALCKWKVVWIDNRFSFVHDRYNAVGGNAVNRSEEQWRADLVDLKSDWGAAIHFDKKGRRRVSLNEKILKKGGALA
jgi:hypothetical protein